jgi:hypothetical protein
MAPTNKKGFYTVLSARAVWRIIVQYRRLVQGAWHWVIFMDILSFKRYSICIVNKRKAGEVCLNCAQKCLLDG